MATAEPARGGILAEHITQGCQLLGQVAGGVAVLPLEMLGKVGVVHQRHKWRLGRLSAGELGQQRLPGQVLRAAGPGVALAEHLLAVGDVHGLGQALEQPAVGDVALDKVKELARVHVGVQLVCGRQRRTLVTGSCRTACSSSRSSRGSLPREALPTYGMAVRLGSSQTRT
jgi:hypothetical protein